MYSIVVLAYRAWCNPSPLNSYQHYLLVARKMEPWMSLSRKGGIQAFKLSSSYNHQFKSWLYFQPLPLASVWELAESGLRSREGSELLNRLLEIHEWDQANPSVAKELRDQGWAPGSWTQGTMSPVIGPYRETWGAQGFKSWAEGRKLQVLIF